MNEVINMLRERCCFNAIRVDTYGFSERELPDSFYLLNPPKDFLEFYDSYDGGGQGFYDHEWKEFSSSVHLSLYSADKTEKKREELAESAKKASGSYFESRNYRPEVIRKLEGEIDSEFSRIIVAGEVGLSSYSEKKATLRYIVFGNGKFYLIHNTEFPTLGLRPLSDWLAGIEKTDGVLISPTLTGILNKIIDLILGGKRTVFELKEYRKKQGPKPKPIYSLIYNAIVDGELPRGFSLPKQAGSSANWADGALDSMSLIYGLNKEPNDGQKALIADLIEDAQSGRLAEAEEKLRGLFKSVRAIEVAEHVLRYIFENRESLNARNLHAFAVELSAESMDTESVKIGLTIFRFYDLHDMYKDVVRLLALSDEFTYFALAVMSTWENGNEEIFRAAQKVHGWGRIHALNRLKPETEEIRGWVLREGIHNKVLNEYSALDCWYKSGAEELLVRIGPLSREEHSAIRDIIDELLCDEPAPGISAVRDGEKFIIRFLEKSSWMSLGEEDYEVITYIMDYYSDEEHRSDVIAEKCRALLGGRKD